MKITRRQLRRIISEEATHMKVMHQLMKMIPGFKNVPRGRPWADPTNSRYIPNTLGWITQKDVDDLGGGQPKSILEITSDAAGREITYTVVRWGGTSGDTKATSKTHVDYVIHFGNSGAS